MKLLAINFGGLGDEVLFLPTLQTIRNEHPEWHITLLCEPRGRGIRDVTNAIDDILTFDIKKKPLRMRDYAELVGLLRGGKFDTVLSSGGSVMVAGLLMLSGARRTVGFGTNALARTVLTAAVPLNRAQHAALMYHDLVRGLGSSAAASRPVVVVHEENRAKMRAMISDGVGEGVKRRVLLHPGTSKLAIAKGIVKNWPAADWAALTKKFLESGDTQVILAGGPDDDETIAQIREALGDAEGHQHFFSAYGKTANLRDLVGLIDVCDVMVCVDSAPMHLGVGVGKPMVALFGPTDPAKLLWPDPRFVALRDPEIAARIGGADVFASGMKSESYLNISVDDVYAAAVKLMP